MLKYAIIQDEATGVCCVGIGDNASAYINMGMTLLDVTQSDIDGKWYLTDKCPMKTDEQKAQEARELLAKTYMTKWDFVKYILNPLGFTYAMLKEVLAKDINLEEAWECCSYVYRGDDTLCANIQNLLPQATPEYLDNAFKTYGTYGG